MKNFKHSILFLLSICFFINFISATTTITGNFVYDNPTLPHLNPTTNQSVATINNSVYWQGYTPNTLPHNILAGLQGGSPGEYYHLNDSVFTYLMTYINLFIKSYNNIALTNQSNNFYGTQTFNNVIINGNLTANITLNNVVHNNLSGLQGTGPDYYHLNYSQYQGILFALNATGSFVPYEGAIQNLNMTGYNITASNMFVPIGGTVNWDSNVSNVNVNGSLAYMFYNGTSRRLEMWVNGKIQQDWGNSTTIYGKATFEADAFFKNMSGQGLLISTNVVVDGNMTVLDDIRGQSVFAGNICYSDGTNCSATGNISIANLTSLIMNINQTLTMEIINLNGRVDYLNASLINLTERVDVMNTTLSNINQTIADIANVNAYSQIVPINIIGGVGFNISTPINYLVTELIVTPPTNTTTYNFQATQTNISGPMIDKDRISHTGIWDIQKQYSLSNNTLYLNIFNSSIDGLFTVQIKYINNKIS